MAIKKKTPTSKSKAAPKKAPAAKKSVGAKKAAPKKAAAAKAAPKKAAPRRASPTPEASAKKPAPKKSPFKKAAIQRSSATALKVAAKKTATKKKVEKSESGATKRAGADKLLTKKKAVKKVREPREISARRENPEGMALARRAGALALDKKATDVVFVDVCGRTSYTDFLIIASAETERQVSAIAEYIEVTLKGEGHRVISSEGHTPGQWVLLDYGEAVIHLFTQEARPFYDLEGMWPEAPRETLR